MFKKIIVIAVLASTATLALTACSNDSKTEQAATAINSNVSAEGVLTAAVILSTGDIDAAVANGTVTPDEVTAAQEAIKNGTLNQYRQKAELEKQQAEASK